MRSPIRVRLALWYTLVLALILLALAAGVYLLLDRSLALRAQGALLESEAEFRALLEHESEEEPNWNALEVVAGAIREATPLGWRVSVYSAVGAPLSSTHPGLSAALEQVLRQEGAEQKLEFLDPPPDGLTTLIGSGEEAARVRAVTVLVRGTPFTVVLFRPVEDEHELMRQLGSSFAVLLPLTLLISAIAGYVLARSSLAPVAKMAAEAERISARNLQTRLPLGNAHDELGALARVFNELLGRLESAFGRQRRFMADASHELRTPVAIIRGEAEVALSRPDRSSVEYQDSLEVVLGEAVRLGRVVDDLFTLARADAGQYPLVLSDIYLDELVTESCRSFRTVAADRGITLTWQTPIEAPFRGDAALLRRLLLNLLDNASRHTPEKGTVQVALADDDEQYRITVSDSGPGIPEADIHLIFERFFRGGGSTDGNSPRDGAGLGLPIARWVAEAHGGRLDLLQTGPAGTTFLLSFPYRRT